MGTEYLMIILMWCGYPGNVQNFQAANRCRREKIECVRKLENFTTDDVIDKCLMATPPSTGRAGGAGSCCYAPGGGR